METEPPALETVTVIVLLIAALGLVLPTTPLVPVVRVRVQPLLRLVGEKVMGKSLVFWSAALVTVITNPLVLLTPYWKVPLEATEISGAAGRTERLLVLVAAPDRLETTRTTEALVATVGIPPITAFVPPLVLMKSRPVGRLVNAVKERPKPATPKPRALEALVLVTCTIMALVLLELICTRLVTTRNWGNWGYTVRVTLEE